MSNMWDDEKIVKANQEIAEALKKIADKIGNDDKIYELELKNRQLQKENERLTRLLESFYIPINTDIIPHFAEFSTHYDVVANKTNVHIAYEDGGHFRFTLHGVDEL